MHSHRKTSRTFRVKKRLFFPLLLGSIIVAGSISLFFLTKYLQTKDATKASSSVQKTAQSFIEKCQGKKQSEFCYATALSSVTKQSTLENAVAALLVIQDTDPSARGCHFIAHTIAYAETEKDFKEWGSVLKRVPVHLCTGGFVHGIIEAYKKLDKSFVLTEKTVPEFCAKVKNKVNKGENSCAHIMGHLLMVEKEGDVSKSLAVCEKIPENMQYECFAGVFMENETRENLYAHGILDRNPWTQETLTAQRELCNTHQGLAQQACWKELAHMFVFLEQHNPSDIFTSCDEAPTTNAKDDCYGHAVGILMASSNLKIESLKDICKPYNGSIEKMSLCMGRAVNAALASSPKFSDRVIMFCDAVPVTNKRACYSYIGFRLPKLISEEELNRICRDISFPYNDYCRGKGIFSG